MNPETWPASRSRKTMLRYFFDINAKETFCAFRPRFWSPSRCLAQLPVKNASLFLCFLFRGLFHCLSFLFFRHVELDRLHDITHESSSFLFYFFSIVIFSNFLMTRWRWSLEVAEVTLELCSLEGMVANAFIIHVWA
jgi:hypothetical protein